MELFLNENVILKIIENDPLFNHPRLFLDTRRVVVSNGNRFDFPEEKSNSISDRYWGDLP